MIHELPYLRSCAGCSAHLLVGTDVGNYARCKRCRAPESSFAEWAAKLTIGDHVYVQPVVLPNPLLSRTQHIVMERADDQFILQPLGFPGARLETSIEFLASEPMVRDR